MYQLIKKLGLALLPTSLWIKWEFTFRKLIYLTRFKGSNYQCSLCKAELSSFVAPQQAKICPACGSLPRSRFLWLLLAEELKIDKPKSVLHFSPQRYLMGKLDALSHITYYPTDFESNQVRYQFDLQKIDLNDHEIDLVICYHVFEHIPKDRDGMKELYRVMKPGAIGFLQVPFKEGDTIEDIHEQDPKVRLQKFGQEDHLRWYNKQDFMNKLKAVGFDIEEVEVKNFPFDYEKLGLNKSEVVIKVKKPKA